MLQAKARAVRCRWIATLPAPHSSAAKEMTKAHPLRLGTAAPLEVPAGSGMWRSLPDRASYDLSVGVAAQPRTSICPGTKSELQCQVSGPWGCDGGAWRASSHSSDRIYWTFGFLRSALCKQLISLAVREVICQFSLLISTPNSQSRSDLPLHLLHALTACVSFDRFKCLGIEFRVQFTIPACVSVDLTHRFWDVELPEVHVRLRHRVGFAGVSLSS